MQDEMAKFNDTQLIRCLLVLSQAHSSKHGRLKDKCISLLINNIMEGKFQFRHGSSIPALAQAINFNHQMWFSNADDLILQSYLSQ